LSVKVKIVGIGGGGINTVNNLIDLNLKGVQFVAVNTDFRSLETSKAPTKLFIGEKITKGKSSNGNPLLGRGAAFQSVGVIKKTFIDSHMVFITAGLSNLKDDVRKEEINYDIIAYLEKDKVILFKNRFGPLTSFELSSELADLFPVRVDAGRYILKTRRIQNGSLESI
jgi:adenylate kinase